MPLITGMPAVTPDVVKEMSKTLFEGFYQRPDISSIMQIVEGIKSDAQLIAFKRHSGLAGYVRSNCETTANTTLTAPTVNKTWSPKRIGDRFSECYETFDASFTAWMLKEGTDKPDLVGTEIGMFIAEQLSDMIQETVQRHAWFGDTAIAALTNNNLSSGQLKFFNAIDGIWKQVFNIVAADANRRTTDTTLTTRNTAGTFAAQAFTSADTTNQIITKALDNVWYGADLRLRSMPRNELVFLTTQTMSDQYERERKSIGTVDLSYMRVEDGVQKMYSNGIEIVPMSIWDRTIREYLGNSLAVPTASTLPHRAILTHRSNIMLGTESIGALDALQVWYSQDDAKMYADYLVKMDAKVGLDNMVQVLY